MENSDPTRSPRNFWRGVFVALAVALAAGFAYAFWIAGRFEKEGAETMGVVTRVYTKTEYRIRRVTRRTSRQEKVTVHYFDYRFVVGGQEHTGSRRLGTAYVDVRKGDSVVVCYLPDDPSSSRPALDSAKNLRIKRFRPRRRR